MELKTQADLDALITDPAKLEEYIKAKAVEMHQEGKLTVPPAPGITRIPMGEAPSPDSMNPPLNEMAMGWQGVDLIKHPASARAQAKALNGQFTHMGEFLTMLAPQTQVQRGGLDPRMKVLQGGEGDAGGFLVPEQFVANLLALAVEMASVRPRAFTMPMGGPTVRIPAIRDTSHATNVFGGVQAYWVPESGAYTEAEPSFSQMTLIAKKLTGYTTASNELLADSAIPLEALLTRLFGEAIAFFEDDAFINGTGAAQPIGILNADCLVSVGKETGQAAKTIVPENLDQMWSRLLPSSQARAIWLAHPDTFPALASMARAVGTGGAPVWIANMAGGPPASIYGRPVIFTEKAQTLGTKGDIYLADFSYYIIGDLQAMTMAASPHVRFINDETVWRFTERLDAKPWLESALTPRYGTNTLSPFISLDTRA